MNLQDAQAQSLLHEVQRQLQALEERKKGVEQELREKRHQANEAIQRARELAAHQAEEKERELLLREQALEEAERRVVKGGEKGERC